MRFTIISLLILIVDQITKNLIITKMNPNETIPVLKGIFHITFVRNPGAAFGIMQNKTTFFIVMTSIVILIILGVYLKTASGSAFFTIALALQLGGAIGNLIDRIRFSYVVDFLDFRIWPVFNIADVAIVVGVTLLAWQLLLLPE